MSAEFILVYSATVFIASITPGPSMLLALDHGIKYGARKTLATAFGNVTATLIQAVLSIAGLGVVLMSSAAVFNAIKYAGAAYLVYMGVKIFFSATDFSMAGKKGGSDRKPKELFIEAFVVTAGNPKAIVFFTALFPQFISTEHSTALQFSVILILLLIIAFICMMIYGVFGHRMKNLFGRPFFKKYSNRIIGGTFIGMGLGLAAGKIEK